MTALAIWEPRAGNANVPPLAYHWLTTHAEPGRFSCVVSRGAM